MKKIIKRTIYECPYCKRRFDSRSGATKCRTNCQRIWFFERSYPEVRDKGCEFASGEGYIQRTAEWYKRYLKELDELLRKNHPSLMGNKLRVDNGVLGRVLNDGDYNEYRLWTRIICICHTCFKEWGQPYYASNCLHDGSITDRQYGGKVVKKKRWKEPIPDKEINPSRRFEI